MPILSDNSAGVKPVSIPRIYSRRKGAETPPPDAVYVGRGKDPLTGKASPYGNPFRCEVESDNPTHLHSRAWACAEFEKYAAARLEREPDWLEPLRGKSLVCWCSPKQCHAETLLRLANAENGGAA